MFKRIFDMKITIMINDVDVTMPVLVMVVIWILI